MSVKGGKAVYGAAIGILMLEARFPRIVGEVGNALTFDFPVHYTVISDASPDRVVLKQAHGLLDAFIAGGRELVARGADGITTNCGFLSLFQSELSEALDVPVATSSLIQLPMIQKLLPPGKEVGIITISSASLSEQHLKNADVPLATPIVGTDPSSHFNSVILQGGLELDPRRAEADLIEAGERLMSTHQGIGAILPECTNMCPYSAALAAHFGVPVFDMVGFIRWFQSGLAPKAYNYD